MDNAKNLSPIFRAIALAVEIPWLQGAEMFAFGTGLIGDAAIAIRGGKMKRNGTAIGKVSFPLIGRRLSTMPNMVSDTSQT